jgi:hypothetical protein
MVAMAEPAIGVAAAGIGVVAVAIGVAAAIGVVVDGAVRRTSRASTWITSNAPRPRNCSVESSVRDGYSHQQCICGTITGPLTRYSFASHERQ